LKLREAGQSLTEVIPMHTPVRQNRNGAEKAVVFIHGFMGSPDSFTDLASAVYENGCSYVSVLLPGHGVRAGEFARFGAGDWERHVQNEIENIRDAYKAIFLVGHSMGGLIALNASLIRENKVAGVFLIATPLKINWLRFKSLFSKLRLLAYPKNHEVKSAYARSNSIAGSTLFSLPFLVKPVKELYQLMNKTKKHLPEVFAPVCMIHSINDETASFKSAKLLDEGLRNTQRTAVSLSKSWHAHYPEDERKIIAGKLIEFIQ